VSVKEKVFLTQTGGKWYIKDVMYLSKSHNFWSIDGRRIYAIFDYDDKHMFYNKKNEELVASVTITKIKMFLIIFFTPSMNTSKI